MSIKGKVQKKAQIKKKKEKKTTKGLKHNKDEGMER